MKEISILLAELDDVVQKLAKQDNVEWASNRTEEKIEFLKIKKEILELVKSK